MRAIPVSRPKYLSVVSSNLIPAIICFLMFSAPIFSQEVAQQATPQMAAAPRPLITQSVDESQLTTLTGNTHPLARAEFDLGAAPSSLPMKRMLLVLKRSGDQEASLERFLDEQQNKNSPNYHNWLTPEQYGQQFGPTDADVQTITAWLQSHGFEVGATKGRTVLEFSGSAGQVQEAFHTSIHKYIVNGEQHWANATDPQIPAALAPAVAGMASLNNFPRHAMNVPAGVFSREKATGKFKAVQPQFTFPSGCAENNQSSNACAYGVGPYDFATIYNVLPLWTSGIDGTGQTIAIVGETNINLQDVTDFRSLFGLPTNNPTIILNGPDPGIQGDESEADIDVQWSGAVARNATIDFVVSQSTETTAGIDLSAVYIVENNLAPLMSESYGYCELGLGTSGNQFYNALWQQAAAQGITVFISAGDSGAAGCDDFNAASPAPAQYGLQVSGFASTPYNVAVGGTDFNDFSNPATYWSTTNDSTTQASALSYIPETTWNDSCTNAIFATVGFSTNAETNCNDSRLAQYYVIPEGGSGGASNCTTPTGSNCAGGYVKPSWQTGKGVPADGKRDIPDVSLFASNGFLGSFYIICQRDQTYGSCSLNSPYAYFLGFGGTSVSSPAFAGIMALVNQEAGRQGNANYVFYKLAAQQPTAFHDVTSGTIAMPCLTGSPNCTTNRSGDAYGVLSGYSAGTGYDLATGLGSVDANNLVTNWNSVILTPSSTTVTNLTPTTITHGQAVNFSVTVTSGTGTPTGQISLIGGPGDDKGIGDFSLTSGSASGSTALFPGGSYSVIAHYPGDGTYASSDSIPVPVSVISEGSKTLPNLVTFGANGQITSFASSNTTYGSGYYLFRVDVGNSNASVSAATGISSSCSGRVSSCPTGTIALTASGTSLNGTSLLLNSEGFAEDQSFPPGSYSISANYSGDASYAKSTGMANFTVAKAPTTASAAAAGLPVEYGNIEQIAADAITTSNGVAPTGTFQFILDGFPLGPPAPVYESGAFNPNSSPPSYAWADASSTTIFLTLGNHALSAQYSGDDYYSSSTSPASTVTVTQAQPFFTTYGWGSASASVGQTVHPTATIFGSEGGAEPGGTMTFFDNGTPISGTVTYTGSAAKPPVGSLLTGTTSYTFTTPGNHNLTINYSGDVNHLPATNGLPNTITVAGPVSVAASSAINISSPGQSGSTILTLTANQGFSGTVALSCTPDPAAKESACSFTSGSSTTSTMQVNLTGASTTVSFTVTTTAPHSQIHSHTMSLLMVTEIGMGAVAIILLPFGRRRFGKLSTLAVMGLLLALIACGGGGSNAAGGGGGGGGGTTDAGTAVGQYTFTVTSVTGSGSSAISLATPVAVVVQ